MRPAEVIGKTSSVSTWYEIMLDCDVYTTSYSFHAVFIHIMQSYYIYHCLCVHRRLIQYGGISDSNESNTKIHQTIG